MQTFIAAAYLPPIAIAAGLMIGYGFGIIQNAATRRHARLEREGRFKSGWAATPGSFRRIAYLLVALALVQFLFPMFFTTDGPSQYCVSAGVALGYGWTLFRQLRRRMT